ncbi:PepSY-associated TM helix domain-containing protein [Propionispora hippei]|uniref:Uncharacterized iron-regulated membrane protein n=1 Tax=Propionispora hippei DSM 15287 TaxID=1123003 RepID=A0A1M6MM04_9FIRM|nr:PepSY-associated TM helix domain-containing protein [Propionispora hippei]SHJ84410.1 Uncharacterized iron-regulated membrane protein [Propionispora hippei DSM 15287]
MRYWYKIHRWIGFICLLFFLLLCLTGLPLLFKTEIHDFNLLDKENMHPASDYRQIWREVDAGERLVKEGYSGKSIRSISVQPDEGRILFRVQDKDSNKPVAARLSMGGEQLAYYPSDHTLQPWHQEKIKYPWLAEFMHEMHRLHMYLGMGKGGMVFLGFMCFLSLVSVVSGCVLYGPFMKRSPFALIGNRSWRERWFSWHKFLGIVTAVWAIILCFSGVVIVVFSLSYGLYIQDSKTAAQDYWQSAPAAGKHLSLAEAKSFVMETFPDDVILSLDLPDRRQSPPAYVFYITPATENPLDFLGQLVFIPDKKGMEPQYFTKPLPDYLFFAGYMLKLHIHNHELLILKILWALLDIALIFVILSGLLGWLRKGEKIERSSVATPSLNRPTAATWKWPGILAGLSLLGLFLPLYGTVGEFAGTLAWLAVALLSIFLWRERNSQVTHS